MPCRSSSNKYEHSWPNRKAHATRIVALFQQRLGYDYLGDKADLASALVHKLSFSDVGRAFKISASASAKLVPDFAAVYQEIKCAGVNLQLLCEEYVHAHVLADNSPAFASSAGRGR